MIKHKNLHHPLTIRVYCVCDPLPIRVYLSISPRVLAHGQWLCVYVSECLDAKGIDHDKEDHHCVQQPRISENHKSLHETEIIYLDSKEKPTAGTYSPLGASSHISNHTKTSCFAKTVDDGGHGKGPNLGLRTGCDIGILGGNMRLGGGLETNSCLASLCNGCV